MKLWKIIPVLLNMDITCTGIWTVNKTVIQNKENGVLLKTRICSVRISTLGLNQNPAGKCHNQPSLSCLSVVTFPYKSIKHL